MEITIYIKIDRIFIFINDFDWNLYFNFVFLHFS
jgi:hypothetical protein